MDQILSLEDKMKAYEINDIVQALYWKIRRPDINEKERKILMRERREKRESINLLTSVKFPWIIRDK